MSKIIIQNDSSISDSEAILRVFSVIQEGRISASRYGAQYCFATRFKDCMVISDKNKKSDRFIIRDNYEN